MCLSEIYAGKRYHSNIGYKVVKKRGSRYYTGLTSRAFDVEIRKTKEFIENPFKYSTRVNNIIHHLTGFNILISEKDAIRVINIIRQNEFYSLAKYCIIKVQFKKQTCYGETTWYPDNGGPLSITKTVIAQKIKFLEEVDK